MATFDDLIRGLGTANAPFGFAPVGNPTQGAVDPALNAGWQMIGNVGMGMLANNTKNPLQAFAGSYMNAQRQAQDNSKNQYLTSQMMQEADAKKQERDQAAAEKQRRDEYIKQFPADVQMKMRSIPGYLEKYVTATDPAFKDPANPGDNIKVIGGYGYNAQTGQWITPPNGGADAVKPPMGYRFTADGNLEAIKGGPADPHVKATAGAGGVTTKMRNDAVSAQQAYDNLNTALSDYKNLIVGYTDKSGKKVPGVGVSVVPGQENDQIVQARTNLQLQLKELYNLGVLNGPDLTLMEQMIFDPQTSVFSPISSASKLYSAAGGWGSTSIEDRANASISNLQKMLKTIVDNKTKGIIDAPLVDGGQSETQVPDGIAPDIWNAMTPEEQALWR